MFVCLFSGEGNAIYHDDRVLLEVPVDEKIIRLVEGLSCIYVLTEFNIFKLDKETFSAIERIHFEGRDRPLAVYETKETLWLVTARGYLHNLSSKQVFQLRSDFGLFYSAAVCGIDDQKITVAFGSIFSGVVIAHLADGVFQEAFVLSGHKGTVFDVQFHPSCANILFSCSDDRSVIKWNLEDRRHKCFTGHEARVWQIAVSDKVVCSVSEDNTCRVWSHEGCLETVINCNPFAKSTLSVSVNDSAVAVGSSDHGRFICDRAKQCEVLLSGFKIAGADIKNFCVDVDGTVFLSTGVGGRIYRNAEELGKIESVARYSVPCVSEKYLIFGDVTGSVHWSDKSSLLSFNARSIGTGKVSKILALTQYTFLVELNDQKCFLFNIRDCIELSCEFKYKCTSAIISHDAVLIGTRNGELLQFCLDGKFVRRMVVSPGESVKALHHLRKSFLLAGTHAGDLVEISMPDFSIASRQSFCKGEIVAFLDQGNLLAAFYQNNLNLIDRQTGIVVERIECKGSHRLWSLNESKSSVFFAFLSDGLLTLRKSHFERVRQLTPSSHGQEIRCAVNFDDFVASGSEDGLIVISRQGRVIETVRSPKNSSIKTLAYASEGILLSAGSSESVDAWKWDGTKLSHIASAPKLPALIESRVMALAVQEPSHGERKVFAGYSNSSIACWSYSEGRFSLLWIHEEVHHGKFLQQLRLTGHHLITAGTDGLVKLWEIGNSGLALLSSACAHSSGINALDYLNGGLLLTGGDDGFISVLQLEESRVKLLRRIQAHHSTCTAVKFVSSERFISASVDQRIVVRNVRTFDIVAQRLSTISDIAALSIEQNFISVYGLGRESFIMSEEKQ